jgi:hypothetical protein
LLMNPASPAARPIDSGSKDNVAKHPASGEA